MRDIVEALSPEPGGETTWQERAEALWRLLDHVDTLDDACRNRDADFRARTRQIAQKRHRVLTSDGYKLFIPGET